VSEVEATRKNSLPGPRIRVKEENVCERNRDYTLP
jgi:hypothetical protein